MSSCSRAGLVDVSLAVVVKQSPDLYAIRAKFFERPACSVYDLGCRESAPLIMRLDQEPVIRTVDPVEMPKVVVLCGLAFSDCVEGAVASALALRSCRGSYELTASPVFAQVSNSLTSCGIMLADSVPEDIWGIPPYWPSRYLRKRLSSFRGGGLRLVKG